MSDPKVSVCVVSYNQKDYIAQCLQSIVDQETNFDFDVIVGDDASTDGTREVIEEFVRRYPNKVRVLNRPSNVGASANYLATHQCATGTYVAHVDGDDYALPGKLQMQADYLDAHPAITVAWHRVRSLVGQPTVLVDDAVNPDRLPAEGFSLRDVLAMGSVAAHSSMMYRREIRNRLDYHWSDIMDYDITVAHLAHGNGVIIPEILGVYRVGIGIASDQDKLRKWLLGHLEYYAKTYPHYRSSVSARAMRLFLADLVKHRRTLPCSARVALRTYHPLWPLRALAAKRYGSLAINALQQRSV